MYIRAQLQKINEDICGSSDLAISWLPQVNSQRIFLAHSYPTGRVHKIKRQRKNSTASPINFVYKHWRKCINWFYDCSFSIFKRNSNFQSTSSRTVNYVQMLYSKGTRLLSPCQLLTPAYATYNQEAIVKILMNGRSNWEPAPFVGS